MAIEKKDSNPGSLIPINDLPTDYFPPLPRSVVARFPELDPWMNQVRERFSVLQRRLWDKERELELWKKRTEDSIA